MKTSHHGLKLSGGPFENAKVKAAVILPAGTELSSRLLTGIYHFMDEESRFDVQEIVFREQEALPLTRRWLHINAAIVWTDRRHRWVNQLVDSHIPVVNCNRDLAGETGVVSLSIDQTLTCEIVLNHLLSRRIRQFAAVGVNFEQRPHTADRCRELIMTAAARGWTTAMHEISGEHPDTDRRRISEVWQEKELLSFLQSLIKPAAVWCENDYVARMVCNAVQHLKLAIPDQIAVMGVGNNRIATSSRPAISSFPLPIEDCGNAAARAVFEWTVSGKVPADLVVPPSTRVIARDTTREMNDDDRTIEESLEIIEQEACDGLSVQQLCDRVGLSRMTLTKRFHAIHSITPGEQIRLVKIENAKRLLSQSDKSVADIAMGIGFSDQSKFGKFFKRETGTTPSAFRQASTWRSD